MVTIILESHATSVDNEAGVASGHRDVSLSRRGRREARTLGQRYADRRIDVIYCSDLRRSYHTAAIAFERRGLLTVVDPRLRECDYGEFTGRARTEIGIERTRRLTEPFPGGESIAQAAERLRAFLCDIRDRHDGETVLIIGHSATHHGLEHWINGISLEEAVAERGTRPPGWSYILSEEALQRMEARA
jgi:broad specificity phosphatase PhoE